MLEFKYTKVCVCCKKMYGSNAIGQRFCSETCRKNYQKRIKERRKFYSETKELQRLKSRSHAIAVEIKRYELHRDNKPFVCEVCGEPAVEVHHKDLNFLNNTPDNLICLCKKCHAQAHSEAEKKEGGKELNRSFYSLMSPLYK